MRLIDAEKIKPFTVTFPAGLMRRHPSAAHFYAEGAQQVLDIIAAAPTVAPETLLPTANWIDRGYVCGEHEYECSACHETEWRTSKKRMKYCMFCGKRMVNADD